MPSWLRVKAWETHQHYRDRSPPWIKLHLALLTDYDWACLPDATKGHLTGIWLLASRENGRIPDDPKWVAAKIGARSRVDLELLVNVGFLVRDNTGEASDVLAQDDKRDASTPLAARKQAASPRALARGRGRDRGREETETTADRSRDPAELESFDEAWKAYPRRPNNSRGKARRAWMARLKEGIDPVTLLAGVRAYAAYVERERVEPKFVKQAATFFGPDRHWEADYGAPEPEMIEVYGRNGDLTPEAARALGVGR